MRTLYFRFRLILFPLPGSPLKRAILFYQCGFYEWAAVMLRTHVERRCYNIARDNGEPKKVKPNTCRNIVRRQLNDKHRRVFRKVFQIGGKAAHGWTTVTREQIAEMLELCGVLGDITHEPAMWMGVKP